MRPILLLVTAALGLSACTTRDCLNTITVQWAFKDPSGNLLDCRTAGVTTAHVFLDGRAQVDQFNSPEFTCSQFPNGVVLTNFPGGNHTLQIDAFSQAGQLLFQFNNTITANRCGDTTLPIDVPAVQGQLIVHFTIPGNQCPTGSFIWYSIFDDTTPPGTLFSAVDGTRTPTSIPCSTSGGQIGFDAVPFGNYTLDFLQVVVPTGNPTTPFGAVFGTQTPFSLPHPGDDTFTVPLLDCSVPGNCIVP